MVDVDEVLAFSHTILAGDGPAVELADDDAAVARQYAEMISRALATQNGSGRSFLWSIMQTSMNEVTLSGELSRAATRLSEDNTPEAAGSFLREFRAPLRYMRIRQAVTMAFVLMHENQADTVPAEPVERSVA